VQRDDFAGGRQELVDMVATSRRLTPEPMFIAVIARFVVLPFDYVPRRGDPM
jgi:hypothetical protein